MARHAFCMLLLLVLGLCLSSPARAQPFDLQNAPAHAGRNGPAKFVVIPVCASSHYYQSLAIVKELSARAHSVQVGAFSSSSLTKRCALPAVTEALLLEY